MMTYDTKNACVSDSPDVVRVVRCKDCRYFGFYEYSGRHFCKRPLGMVSCVFTAPDDFCSNGKRRDDHDVY